MLVQVKRLVRLKGTKNSIRRRARHLWPVNYDATYQNIHGAAECSAMKLEKQGIPTSI